MNQKNIHKNNDNNSIFNEKMLFNPFNELIAYEALFNKIERPSFKHIQEKLDNLKPSHFLNFIEKSEIDEIRKQIKSIGLQSFNYLVKESKDYPQRLLSLSVQLEILYYKGDISLLNMPSVAIVGSRKASERGLSAAGFIASRLVGDGYAIVSGLAEGIDRAAHLAAIRAGGKTIAVIGTPLNESYPPSNSALQKSIEKKYLLVSQIPFVRYTKMNWSNRRYYFPERNKTMAALTEATIIAEASETSGTRTQARECLRLNKKLIFLQPILDNPNITWPHRMLKEGAFVANNYSDVIRILKNELV
ncbi:MAG: DNA-protecting protein DprA [Candidatus Cloacimonetes bacterium]|nr:DNA-protecting protein DprA [Candidatus Cloacimonadota bacterium]